MLTVPYQPAIYNTVTYWLLCRPLRSRFRTYIQIMTLAIINGLITSIILETIILLKQMDIKTAIKTAFGMSFISMLGMEISMNITDVLLTGGATITWWATPIMLFMGFITPLPYNYWRLKKYNKSCH